MQKLITHQLSLSIIALALLSQLTACVPVIVGGVAAGGAMAADRRTSGIYIEDEGIEQKAERAIQAEIGPKIHANVTSYNRNVLVTGEAVDEQSRTRAVEIVTKTANVKTVTNELVIGTPTALSSWTNDAYITSKIKARFVAANQFPANHVKIVTENGNVYLMGIVTRAEGNLAADLASQSGGVTNVVKVFEYLD